MGGDSYDHKYAELIYKLEKVSVDDNDFKRRLQLVESNPLISDSILFAPVPSVPVSQNISNPSSSPLIVFNPPNSNIQENKVCLICKRNTNQKWVKIPSCSSNTHIFCEDCAIRSIIRGKYKQRMIQCKVCGSSTNLQREGVIDVLCSIEDDHLSQSQISFENGSCPYHGDLLLYICVDCSEPICIKCQNGYHSSHTIETLDTSFSDSKDEINKIELSIRKKLDCSAKSIEKLLNIQNKLNEDTNQRINSIHNEFDNIRMLLNKKEEELIKNLKQTEAINAKKAEERITRETQFVDKCDNTLKDVYKGKRILEDSSPLEFVQYMTENREKFESVLQSNVQRDPYTYSKYVVPKCNTYHIVNSIKNTH